MAPNHSRLLEDIPLWIKHFYLTCDGFASFFIPNLLMPLIEIMQEYGGWFTDHVFDRRISLSFLSTVFAYIVFRLTSSPTTHGSLESFTGSLLDFGGWLLWSAGTVSLTAFFGVGVVVLYQTESAGIVRGLEEEKQKVTKEAGEFWEKVDRKRKEREEEKKAGQKAGQRVDTLPTMFKVPEKEVPEIPEVAAWARDQAEPVNLIKDPVKSWGARRFLDSFLGNSKPGQESPPPKLRESARYKEPEPSWRMGIRGERLRRKKPWKMRRGRGRGRCKFRW